MGNVYLVGAGPGDPGLLTRRGADLLARADVVVYDHLASPRLLDLAPPTALRLCAGKSVGHCTMTQDRIHEVLIEHALAGRSVVRLKGGDPLVFGRGAEEAAALRDAGIPFEVVPGVTAGRGRLRLRGHPGDAPGDRLGRRVRHRPQRPGGRRSRRPARLERPRTVPGHPGRLHGRDPPGLDLPHVDPRGEAGGHAGRDRRVGDPALAADPCRDARRRYPNWPARRAWAPLPS